MSNYYRDHSCEDFDGECQDWDGYHGNRPTTQAYAPWERDLLGLRMFLEVTTLDGHTYTFENVAVDATTVRNGTLEFEGSDTSSKTRLTYVPNVAHWSTFYR